MRSAVALLILLGSSLAHASPGPTPLPVTSTIPVSTDVAYPQTIKLVVDTSDTTRRVYKVHEDIPVAAAGDLVLL